MRVIYFTEVFIYILQRYTFSLVYLSIYFITSITLRNNTLIFTLLVTVLLYDINFRVLEEY